MWYKFNSKSTTNSFAIFACGKEAFILDNIKINPGFYISIIFLIIQLGLYLFFILVHLKKNQLKKFRKIIYFELNSNWFLTDFEMILNVFENN